MTLTKKHIPLQLPSENDPSFRWMVIAFLVLVETMLYSASLIHGLVADDFVFQEFHKRSFSSFWSQASDLHGHWRPLSYSLIHLLFGVFGEASLPWHVLNILVHLTSVLLFFHILLRFSDFSGKSGLAGPAVAAIVFQVHPAAVQNVYWASGFSDLLCMMFLLSALFCSAVMLRNRKTYVIVLAALSFGAALLSEESGVLFPIVLAVVLYLVQGTWQAVWNSHKRLLSALALLSVFFVAAYAIVAGQILLKGDSLFAGSAGVLSRGIAMLLVPTDALRIYQLGVEAPLAAVGVAAFFLFLFVVLLRMKLLNVRTTGLLAATFLAWLMVYAAAGYVSLRLMYGSVGFFVMAVFLVLRAKPWWQEKTLWTRLLRGSIAVYCLATLFYSFSAVMDWHVADKYAAALRASFIDRHLAVQEREYIFGALPSRLRQAEILGEPATDFRGQLRQDELSDSVDMKTLLRVVLLDRDDVSANVLLLRTSDTSLIVNTQTESQFFLFGKVDTPHELPVGTTFEEGVYSLEVLETILNDRPIAVRVTVKDPTDLNRLLFYDDQGREFVSLEGIEAMSRDAIDE